MIFMDKIRVGILGATGIVGQNYIRLLDNHPWFEVNHLVASEKSAGKKYSEAVAERWHMSCDIPERIKELYVHNLDDFTSAKDNCDFVFSALDANIAKVYEEIYAQNDFPVISNASAHRHTPDVPMLIPEINPEHIDIIPLQKKNRGWHKGFIVVKSNCSLQSYMTPLSILHKKYGLRQAIITTMQSVSGAGYPGVSSYDIIDNIIPYIRGEEEKSEREPLKILGKIHDSQIVPATDISFSAHCNRVATIDGHMACVSVSFANKPTIDEILTSWKEYVNIPYELKLPSATRDAVVYRDEPDRPQTRLDRYNSNGMGVVVGRLRECNVLQYRFVGLSHNTIRGAAGGGILNAELLKAKHYL
jgi:aspartate-semialdehyde dehydrogenase